MRQTRLALIACFLVPVLGSVLAAEAASVSLAWDSNRETDIGGYVVSYGTAPGTYTTSMDVGLVTSFQVGNLAGGTKYYLSVRAYNRARQMSDYATEVMASTPGNLPPTLQNPGTQRSAAGSPASLQFVGSDPEKAPLRYAASGLPPGLQVGASTGLVSGTLPTTKLRKSYRVVATVTDDAGGSAAQSFDWYVGKNALLNSSAATLSDMNGDGRDDVFLYDDATGDWSLALSRAERFVKYQGRMSSGYQVVMTSLNADGFGDLFLYNPDTGEWVKALSNGDGGFAVTTGALEPGWTVAAGDFDGDGKSDALLYSSADGRWGMFPRFAVEAVAAWSGGWAPGFTVGTMRLNADAYDDVLLHDPDTGAWMIAFSDGRRRFRTVNGQWAAGFDVYPVNLDGNVVADLLLYNPATGQWAQGVTVGDGIFSFTWGAWSAGLEVRTGDFDGDYRDDSVLYDQWTGAWGVCLTIASGAPECRSGVWFPGWRLSVGDFDGDRIKDLLFFVPAEAGWHGFRFQGGGKPPQSVK